MQIFVIEAMLLLFLIAATIVIIMDKDLLSASVVYCGFSFCAMLLYIMI